MYFLNNGLMTEGSVCTDVDQANQQFGESSSITSLLFDRVFCVLAKMTIADILRRTCTCILLTDCMLTSSQLIELSEYFKFIHVLENNGAPIDVIELHANMAASCKILLYDPVLILQDREWLVQHGIIRPNLCNICIIKN